MGNSETKEAPRSQQQGEAPGSKTQQQGEAPTGQKQGDGTSRQYGGFPDAAAI